MKKVVLSLIVGGLSISGDCFAADNNFDDGSNQNGKVAFREVKSDSTRSKIKGNTKKVLENKKFQVAVAGAVGAAGAAVAAYYCSPSFAGFVNSNAKVVANYGKDASERIKAFLKIKPASTMWNKTLSCANRLKDGVYDFAAPYVSEAYNFVAPYGRKARDFVSPYVSRASNFVAPYVDKAYNFAAPYARKVRDFVSPYAGETYNFAAPYVKEGYNGAINQWNNTPTWAKWYAGGTIVAARYMLAKIAAVAKNAGTAAAKAGTAAAKAGTAAAKA